MNVKNNKRHQETIANIENAFISLLKDTDINKISVTELCEAANIDRSAFYKNYADAKSLRNRWAKL